MSFPTERRILILQHPQEQDALLGTAQLLVASLPKAKLVIGLSWANLAHAASGLRPPADAALSEEGIDPRRWAVLFPDREAPGAQVAARSGALLDPTKLEGIVVLDGTWSKAKTLWWRNPWLAKMNRMTLQPKQPSIYGRLRAEPRREYVSTLESVACALTLCGERPEIEAGLYRVFRTLVQRVRDANIPAPERRLPRRTRPPRARPPLGDAVPTLRAREGGKGGAHEGGKGGADEGGRGGTDEGGKGD